MAGLVAVTGGGGFIATELIHQLLAKGYNVRATVRNRDDASRVGHLTRLAEALPGSVELVNADLLAPGAFDSVFAGCRFVFHTASPFFIEAADPQAQLVDPAVRGTQNVMRAVALNKGDVRRVVLTSSCAALKGSSSPAPPRVGTTYSEADWNETSTLEREAYWLSKVQAERTAWAAAEEHGLDLVTVLPEFVMGPLIAGRTDATSMGYFKMWVEGAALDGAPVFADVRDVARAHILAAENPAASGRYIVANSHSTPANLISTWLQERYPQYQFGVGEEGEGSKEMIDNSRVQRELGLSITPAKETLLDMAATLIQLGLATPKQRSSSGA